VTSFLQDLRFAFRRFRSSPGFSAVAVATLALGIGAGTAIFSVVRGVLLRPLPFRDPARLVRVGHIRPDAAGPGRTFSPQDFEDLQKRSPGFESAAAYFHVPGQTGANLAGAGDPTRIEVAFVSREFFGTLGVSALHGRLPDRNEFLAGRDRVAVLSEAFSRSRFGGGPAPVGRVVRIDGEPFTVVGVMPPAFGYPAASVEAWLPISLIGEDDTPSRRGLRWQSVVARLASGWDVDRAAAATNALMADLERTYPDSNEGFGRALVVSLQETIVGSSRRALLILLAAVGLVLLVACANVANLLAARAVSRRREIGIRTALGASRGRVVRLVWSESLLLAVAGGIAGVLLAAWGLDLLSSVAAERIPRWAEVRLDGAVLAFAAATAILSGSLAGLLPALRLSRALSTEGLGSRVDTGREGSWPALVAAETALTAILLVGAALLSRSVWRLLATDPGFSSQNVLSVAVTLADDPNRNEEQRETLRGTILARLRALPSVAAVGASKTMPLSGGGEPYNPTTEIAGRRVPVRPEGGTIIVTDGYFEALRIPILRGRAFTRSDIETGAEVAVINRALAARIWGEENPVGRRLRFGENDQGDVEIVGVAGDVRHEGLERPAPAAFYLPSSLAPRSNMKIFLRGAGDPASLAAAVRTAIHSVDPALPISDVQTLRTVVASEAAAMRLLRGLLLAFGAAAVILAALGVAGTVAWAISRRTREIGVRMALGATLSQVEGLFLRRGIAPGAAGIAAGLALSAAAGRALSAVLFEISPLDPLAYTAAALLLAGAIALAAWITARRAARVDPVVALRSE
jgi:predicted permease